MEENTQSMTMFERHLLALNGVEAVEAFDENKVLLKTALGLLEVKGENMTVKTLDLENGRLELDGTINGWEYQEDKGAKVRAKSKSIFTRLTR